MTARRHVIRRLFGSRPKPPVLIIRTRWHAHPRGQSRFGEVQVLNLRLSLQVKLSDEVGHELWVQSMHVALEICDCTAQIESAFVSAMVSISLRISYELKFIVQITPPERSDQSNPILHSTCQTLNPPSSLFNPSSLGKQRNSVIEA